MSYKRPLNRKQFLALTLSSVAASTLAACGEETPLPAGGSGSGGTTGGTPPAGGSSGAGGSAAGSTSTGGGGSSSTGGGGSSSTGGGGAGGMGGGSGGAGGGGGGGGAGGGGGSGGGGGGTCGTAKVTHTSDNLHDHIPMDSAQFLMALKDHINGATATMPFMLPSEGVPEHIHTITLTAAQVMTLKSGGMVTGVESSDDEDHTHDYTISCMA